MKCKLYDNILDTVGHTPIVKLNKVTKDIQSNIYAKLEFFNPTGSSKDRIAKHLVEKALERGSIKKGQALIEKSSGNTGIALAMAASQNECKLKVVLKDYIAQEKITLLEAMGVNVVKVDSTLPPEAPASYTNIIKTILEKDKGYHYYINQHNNLENIEAHYMTTGPEIWEQMNGEIDYLVAGIGTGGTISGTARYLKEKKPSIKIIGVDPVGSVFYDYFHTKKLKKPQPYRIEGLGDMTLIDCVDFTIIDDILQVSDFDAFISTRELIRKEGILAGGSSGAVLHCCLQLARLIDTNANIVTIFPDSAFRYTSTILNENWMQQNVFSSIVTAMAA